MSDEYEWGPWIEHDGKPVPHLVGQWVDVVTDGWSCAVRVRTGYGYSWTWTPGYFHAIRYRIRKPRALQTLIEIAANPAPLPEEVTV